MSQTLCETLLRKREVLSRTGWSNSSLYLNIQRGHFKPGVKIGKRMVAWPSSEVDQYIQSCIAKRQTQTTVGSATV